jgi:hypothetical protein
MKRLLLTWTYSALVIGLVVCPDCTGGAHAAEPQGNAPIPLPTIRPLARQGKTISASKAPSAHDPFSVASTAIPVTNTVSALSVPTAPPATLIPALSVLGKQQDEQGWAVFIALSGTEGGKGQVWVVRQGETFDDRFRVSKLAPPVLIISGLRSRQTKTFDIGIDEE